jgi:hypothetical protein
MKTSQPRTELGTHENTLREADVLITSACSRTRFSSKHTWWEESDGCCQVRDVSISPSHSCFQVPVAGHHAMRLLSSVRG